MRCALYDRHVVENSREAGICYPRSLLFGQGVIEEKETPNTISSAIL